MRTALTTPGTDPSGGAGIQADLKTMTAHRVYGMSAITAVVAQNTTGVTGIMEVTPEFLAEQLDDVFTDIFPDAVKIGMVSSSALIRVIAKKLKQYHAKNIVLDPVMVALIPLADVITPNIPEMEVLSGMTIQSDRDMERAAAKFAGDTCHCAVLCKGGHQLNDANDLLYADGENLWFYGKRIATSNTHGTGCTLSSAIASNLAKGRGLAESVRRAKAYLSGALGDMLDLGKGSGPMNHAFAIEGEYGDDAGMSGGAGDGGNSSGSCSGGNCDGK